ncbi:MAG: autotransporter domain-containing protein, partial [Planctomycetota bacterium]|nr:autotransporter domain-containing protein [Planctomycetota bacterium]
LGAGLEWGINLKRTDRYLLSFEMGVHYQDFYDEFLDKGNVPGSVGDNNQAGKSNGIRIGLRWRFAPCCKWHPTLRAGIAWQSYTGGPEALELAEIDSKGDYLGAYVGAGLEWDINARWSTGPEVAVFYGVDPESGDTALAPTLYWHINYKF